MRFGNATPIQSCVVVAVPCPSKFHICSYGSMLIQILMLWLWINTHPGYTSRIVGQPLWKSTFAVLSQCPSKLYVPSAGLAPNVLSHCPSETHTCLWCSDAHVDAPTIGSASIQGLDFCPRANFQLHECLCGGVKTHPISMN